MMDLQRLDDLMAEKKKDALLLYFKYQNTDMLPKQSIDEHLRWFDKMGISYQQVVDFKNNRDYGDICYFIDFDTADDPRISLYSQQFEDEKFISLKPAEYQMYLYNWVSWFVNGGDLHYEEGLDENPNNG